MARPGRRILTRVLASAAAVALAATLAGCGGGKKSSTQKQPISAAANTAYERSNSECTTVQVIDLAHKYHVKATREAVATASGKYWAQRAGGGPDAAAAGKAGCLDAFASLTPSG